MNEKQFEDILSKYPELIEKGLKFKERQVHVRGKYVDLLFEDRHGQTLIVELKIGTIKRGHTSQLLDYEGHFLSPDDHPVRVMLIGNRVPPNLRRSLDYHGFEWREITVTSLIEFLKEKADRKLLAYFQEEELETRRKPARRKRLPFSEPREIPSSEGKAFGDEKKGTHERGRLWYEFFSQLLEKSNQKTPLFASISRVGNQNWVPTSSGKSGVNYVYVILQYKARVELSLYYKVWEVNERRFKMLKTRQNQVEEAFGEPLDWNYKEGRKEQRVFSWCEIGGLADKEKWPEIQDDLVDRMVRLDKALRPHFSTLPD